MFAYIAKSGVRDCQMLMLLTAESAFVEVIDVVLTPSCVISPNKDPVVCTLNLAAPYALTGIPFVQFVPTCATPGTSAALPMVQSKGAQQPLGQAQIGMRGMVH